ncbi:MAG: hypothetical protein L6V35_04805 [Alistipes putredinis]|nr:MAG: hypothetical protein L6V35_04805 [Alistipes putredinis]
MSLVRFGGLHLIAFAQGVVHVVHFQVGVCADAELFQSGNHFGLDLIDIEPLDVVVLDYDSDVDAVRGDFLFRPFPLR